MVATSLIQTLSLNSPYSAYSLCHFIGWWTFQVLQRTCP